MKSFAHLVLIAALLGTAACQPATEQASSRPSAGTADTPDRWRLWFVDANGLSPTPTETSDGVEGRVGGSFGTTLVTACNGNDPTAYLLYIETADGPARPYAPMAGAFTVTVLKGGNTLFEENARANRPAGPNTHEATTALSTALRAGDAVVLRFPDAEPHRYTLRKSAEVMDKMGCDPNLL